MENTLAPDDTRLLNMLATNGKSEISDKTLKTHMTFGTKNYTMFNLVPGNRSISESHVEHLIEKIKGGENFLVYSPIMVDEKMRVLDGQHRLLAAKAAGVHIWYNIVKGKINLDTIARINENQRKWSPNNFVHMYASMGNAHYKAFEQFYRGYKLSVSTGLLLFGNQTMTSLRNGTLEVTDILRSEELADALIDVQKFVPFAKYNRFANAFKRVFENQNYNHKRMLSKLEQRKHTIKKLTTVPDYIRLLEGIYNDKLSDTKKIRFY
jgi:hypothetical protein|tara:strand:+ start:43 stop:840 length:798 start_codon:yes stop_codon:yes gene_type:complete